MMVAPVIPYFMAFEASWNMGAFGGLVLLGAVPTVVNLIDDED